MTLILRADGDQLIQYLASRLPHPPDGVGPGSFLTASNGAVRAAWMFEPSVKNALELHVAADDPRWATRSNLRSMFWQGFVELGASRIMTGIGETNRRSFRLARWAGFAPIGLLPRWYETGEGCWLMDMLRADCRWLEEDDG